MDNKFIYEGSRIKKCVFKENIDYNREEKVSISEDYFCRFYEYDLENRRQKIDMKVVVGNSELENNPFSIEVEIASSFLVYDIRYMQDIKGMLKEEALGDLLWSYLASLVLKVTLWSNKYPAYFLGDFNLEDLQELD